MSDFLELAKMYLANEEKLVKILLEVEPLLAERKRMEGLDPSFAGLRAAEVKIRKPANQEKAEEEKKRIEREEKKRKAAEEMEKLGSARKKRGDKDPPKSTTTTLDPESSGQNVN